MNAWKWTVALSFVIVATAAIGTVPLRFAPEDVQAGPSVDLNCVVKNCLTESEACFGDKYCLGLMACERGCFSEWEKDTSPQKLKVLNCTSICQFSYLYNQQVSSTFLGCVATHACLSIPAIPSTCHSSVKPSQKLSVKDLVGDWWVVRGFHPVFDCYACQYFGFQMSSSGVDYSASYKVPLANGSIATVSQKFSMPNTAAGQGIKFSYIDAGVPLEDTWYLLDKAADGSYLLVYYCGTGLTWNYEGGVVLSRKTSLPEEAYKKIASTYNTTVGISFSKFCSPSVEGCM